VIEIEFDLPVDFSHRSVEVVPGMLMKTSLNDLHAVPLKGSSAKVTTGHFMIGLSAAKIDVDNNVSLLKSDEWIDIPLVYADGRRAILALHKGPPGDSVFNTAFAAWDSSALKR
jgi:hypothetical protein